MEGKLGKAVEKTQVVAGAKACESEGNRIAVDFNISELVTKSEHASTFLSAIANRKRLLVLCALAEGEKNVTEIAALVDLRQSPLSQHLAKLRALKLVCTRRDGQSILYRLACPRVTSLLKVLHQLYCE